MNEDRSGIGPQVDSDPAFTKKARLHQSRYREQILKQPYGCGPYRHSATCYGNMLVGGELTGANFLTPEIFEYAKTRVAEKLPGETIEPYRLFNNMLSSQPMCFNLFVPMMSAIENREDWVSTVFASLFPQFSIESISTIRIEFAPLPQSYYIGDKSAFDAFVEYRMCNGGIGIIGIETKYTDKLGKNSASNYTEALDVAHRSGCFTGEGLTVLEKGIPQIVRNYLLTEAYRMKHRIDESHSLILSPAEDKSGIRELERFKLSLNTRGQSRISHLALERFVETVQQHCPSERRKWIDEFERRYVRFGAL